MLSASDRAAPLIAKGYGDRRLANALGVTRHQARVLIGEAQRAIPTISSDNVTELYESACRALTEATTVVAVKDVHDKGAAIREYCRLMGDRTGQVKLGAFQVRCAWKMGQLLKETEKNTGTRGQLRGDIPVGGVVAEPPTDERPTLAEMGIPKKLSAYAQKVGSISERAIEARIAAWQEKELRNSGRVVVDIFRDGPINGARSVMGSRQEPDDSLDYFPTPPWATRALMDRLFPHLGYFGGGGTWNAWEPACGEGHISEVLKEYFYHVWATDCFEYRGPHEQDGLENFLGGQHWNIEADWIITNPPFSGSTDRALEFTLRALELARVGVAMFVRSQWAVEGQERYERLFHPHPPTLCAFFTERVNLCKGRWDPNGGTATAYCWLVWLKRQKPGDGLQEPRPPFWIPPGCRKSLTRPDDIARFAAWSLDAPHDPATGEIP